MRSDLGCSKVPLGLMLRLGVLVRSGGWMDVSDGRWLGLGFL